MLFSVALIPVPLTDIVMPTRCGVCGIRGVSPCARCLRTCRSQQIYPDPPLWCSSVIAPFVFEGSARSLITAAKYRGNVCALKFLAGRIAQAVVIAQFHDGLDVVSWAPTSPQRQRRRGFDQAHVLAAHVATLLGLPCHRLLVHQHQPGRNVAAQTGLDRDARLLRSDRFRFVGPTAPLSERVLLVDDVMTTGATLSAAARVLRDAGALSVTAAVAAVTLSTRPIQVVHTG